jgi:hypothetical protein
MHPLNEVFSIQSDYARHRDRLEGKESSYKRKQCSYIRNRDTVQSSEEKDSSRVSQDRRLKRIAVIREERWTSGVASSRKKIYQLVVL